MFSARTKTRVQTWGLCAAAWLPWGLVAAEMLWIYFHILHMVPIADDFIFSCSGSADLFEHMGVLWRYANGRFGDLTNVIWLKWMPREWFALLCALMVGACFSTLLVLSRCTKGLRCLAMLLLATYLLPWRNLAEQMVVQLNYVWSIAFAGAFCLIMFSRRVKSRWWLLAFPLAFLAGQGHECIGLPLFCGLGLWLWVNRKSVPRVKVWLCAGMFIGVAVLVAAPGNYYKTAYILPAYGYRPWYYLFYPGLMAVVSALLLFAALMKRRFHGQGRRMRSVFSEPWAALALASMLALPFLVITCWTARAGWGVQFFGLAALGMYCPRGAAGWKNTFHGWAAYLLLLCWGIWYSAELLIWQARWDRKLVEYREAFLASPVPQCYSYGDLPQAAEVPMILAHRLGSLSYDNDYALFYLWKEKVDGQWYDMRNVPALRRLEQREGE